MLTVLACGHQNPPVYPDIFPTLPCRPHDFNLFPWCLAIYDSRLIVTIPTLSFQNLLDISQSPLLHTPLNQGLPSPILVWSRFLRSPVDSFWDLEATVERSESCYEGYQFRRVASCAVCNGRKTLPKSLPICGILSCLFNLLFLF